VGRAVLDAICEEAAAAADLDDFGDDWFLGPLAAWAEDLAQPTLTDFGRRFLRSLAVKDVARRLRVLDVLRRHPEIADVPIPPVLYITGLERSGSTLLHNVLARHRAARALLRWELMQPVPPPEAGTYSHDPRIPMVQASIEKVRGSPLERMHWVNADEPSECAWGFIDAVSMLGQAPFLCMPLWRRFLIEEDPTPAYRHYRRVVQMLLWKHPVPPGGRLVLKSPQIAAHVDSFARAFPEAHFVVTDRDPYRCVVSLAAMGHGIVAPFLVDNPLTDDGLRDRIALAWMTPKLTAIAEFSTAQPERITHIAYPDLVANPAETAHAIFAATGLPIDDGIGRAITTFLDSQRAGGRAAPPEQLPTMGYTENDVRSEPAIRDYCQRFDVHPETERLTGVHSSR
jgi:sulfotransferase family protein